VIDYSRDYPQRNSHIICRISYEELKKGEVTINNKIVEVSSLSSYNIALEIAETLKDDILKGEFLLSRPIQKLPIKQGFHPLTVRAKNG
jgi:uncharacterized protein (DUF39 family)